MKKILNLTLIVLTTILSLYSCSQEDNFISSEELVVNANSVLSINSENLDSIPIIALEVNPDSIKSKLFKNKLKSNYAYGDDYDKYFSENMWAIRELPVSLQARGGANTSNRYLSTNGKGKEVTLVGSVNSNNQKFYLKVLPASSGIPYLIYSWQEKTPLTVGQYQSNPNNKILFIKNDDSGSLYSSSWDLIPSYYGYNGCYAIQSESYIGQSDPNNMWSIFYHVLEVRNDNKIGYAKYSNKAQQEFYIKPEFKFTLSSITYDTNSSVLTPLADYQIVTNTRNESYSPTLMKVPITHTAQETSNFSQGKSLPFEFTNPSRFFPRPKVEAGRLILPDEKTPSTAQYKPSTYPYYVKNTLNFTAVFDAPERCSIKITSYVKAYSIKIDYTATATYYDRTIKLAGVWTGVIYLPDNISQIRNIPRFFDLETGEEILMLRNGQTKK